MADEPKQAELAEVVVADETALTAPKATDVESLLRLAIENKLDVDAMKGLYDLSERVADRQAAQEFAAALAQFQDSVPPVERKTTANVVTGGGASYSYKYAELDQIVRTIQPILRQNALSFTWDSKTAGDDLTCTCTLRHVNGHAITASFQCSTKSRAGMSEPQKAASALTFAKRQSLIQVLGLTTCDPDNDGEDATTPPISDGMVADLEALIEEVGADRARFLKWLNVPSLDKLQERDFQRAVQALEKKRKA